MAVGEMLARMSQLSKHERVRRFTTPCDGADTLNKAAVVGRGPWRVRKVASPPADVSSSGADQGSRPPRRHRLVRHPSIAPGWQENFGSRERRRPTAPPLLNGYRRPHSDYAFEYRTVDFDHANISSYATLVPATRRTKRA